MSMEPEDWTAVNGRTNSSDAFIEIAAHVARIMRNHSLGCDVESTARLIVAQLAHVYGLAPVGAQEPKG